MNWYRTQPDSALNIDQVNAAQLILKTSTLCSQLMWCWLGNGMLTSYQYNRRYRRRYGIPTMWKCDGRKTIWQRVSTNLGYDCNSCLVVCSKGRESVLCLFISCTLRIVFVETSDAWRTVSWFPYISTANINVSVCAIFLVNVDQELTRMSIVFIRIAINSFMNSNMRRNESPAYEHLSANQI